MTQPTPRKTRVLFFAWGDSIHARRRIGIFCDDPSFEVGVVSTFRYDFANARNFYLSGAQAQPKSPRQVTSERVPQRAFLTRLVSTAAARPLRLYRLLRDTVLVRRAMRDFQPDVVFLQTALYPCYLSFFWLSRIPMIVTFWNGDLTWWAKRTGVERMFKKQIVRYAVNRADGLTVNSQAAFQVCLEYGAPREKIHLIRYPGVDLRLFRPGADGTDLRTRLGIAATAQVVFCPRGVAQYLNGDVVIEAAAEVVKMYPGTVFLFIVPDGNQDVWASLLRRAGQLGIKQNIVSISSIPWQEMPVHYQAADMMVSNSSNDSLPSCMLEAMACGIPVIMGDIPQIREWVRDSENGYCVSPRNPAALADRIMRVLSDRDGLVDRFIQHNLRLVRREVDSRLVAETVKALVRDLANREMVIQ